VHGKVLHVGWADSSEWNGDNHWVIYVWFFEGTTDWDLYMGFRRAGAPCSGAWVVRAPCVEEPQGIGALVFRQVSLAYGSIASNS
jgi:hypothetical protein